MREGDREESAFFLKLAAGVGVITITTLHTLQNKSLDGIGSQPRATS